MSTDLPEGARCTSDLDCVLLSAWPSYRSQIVRLCAIEKGIKWKHFEVDIHKAMTQFEPWYVNVNPKAYVPTMLVGEANTPVCESADIIKYIDEHFEGKVKL